MWIINRAHTHGQIAFRGALFVGISAFTAWPAVSKAEPLQYTFCYASIDDGQHDYVVSNIVPVSNDNGIEQIKSEWISYLRTTNLKIAFSGFPGAMCYPYATKEEVAESNRTYEEKSNHRRVLYLNWSGTPPIPQGPIKTYTLRYEDGELAGHGYRNASINLDYRFLLCADEIQVAYGLDRNSLAHDDRYVVKMIAGRNFQYATPTSQPVVPQAVPINLRVTIAHQNMIKTVARLQDAAAGVSLGLGCFTGQTKRVGMLKALLGPAPTRTQVQAYLDSLILDGSTIDLDMPLTNPEFPAPPKASAARKPAARKHG